MRINDKNLAGAGQHAKGKCRGGTILFFPATGVLKFINTEATRIRTSDIQLYRDRFGEFDVGYQRGNEMYLHVPTFEHLQQMVIECDIDSQF